MQKESINRLCYAQIDNQKKITANRLLINESINCPKTYFYALFYVPRLIFMSQDLFLCIILCPKTYFYVPRLIFMHYFMSQDLFLCPKTYFYALFYVPRLIFMSQDLFLCIIYVPRLIFMHYFYVPRLIFMHYFYVPRLALFLCPKTYFYA